MIKPLLIYFLIISLISAVITAVDKRNAIKGKRRIPEDFLITLGLVGGALSELTTMKLIHHKTKHKKFMLGLPIEIAFHIAIIILIYLYK